MKKILIANRGEIALRVMRTAKKMGIKTVAVYSEADEYAPFVSFADEAYLLGPAPSDESYLKMDKIIEIAKRANVDGIHPGYGFLSENASFSQKVTDAGIKFIGPKPHAITVMGSKLAAKQTVKAFDIPMVPGTDHAITDAEAAKKIASDIGFPILIKASAGGGGKGMRIVDGVDVLEEQMSLAVSEATSSFGDGSVFIEKYIASPRHIEVQILADQHGNIVHLFERECSVQRRHQKVVEEAPSAVLTEQSRLDIGKAAVDVARSCDYEGAGTVEFILDTDGAFYFLEMNTRLQVEHPVTELITGVDLVEQQIRIARGEGLAIKQDELKINGHSIELRVYAEDPENNFLPSIGRLTKYQLPEGTHVRVDDAFEEGMDVPIYYDPMIAKLIVWNENRDTAIETMKQAILDYKIDGIKTTLDFGLFVMHHPNFVSGDFNTHFVKNYFNEEGKKAYMAKEAQLVASLAVKLVEEDNSQIKLPNSPSETWVKR